MVTLAGRSGARLRGWNQLSRPKVAEDQFTVLMHRGMNSKRARRVGRIRATENGSASRPRPNVCAVAGRR